MAERESMHIHVHTTAELQQKATRRKERHKRYDVTYDLRRRRRMLLVTSAVFDGVRAANHAAPVVLLSWVRHQLLMVCLFVVDAF